MSGKRGGGFEKNFRRGILIIEGNRPEAGTVFGKSGKNILKVLMI